MLRFAHNDLGKGRMGLVFLLLVWMNQEHTSITTAQVETTLNIRPSPLVHAHKLLKLIWNASM
ncbi:hypothetical protein GIB67_000705 [Kingdonia uniflora]|uniref:Uncharacterized protein n=1 Tax=Kingdonia uniflora TaxID=39325 RepID=A0A7J7NCZ9_9MAGN|nr:hypothetical protein GIB67_000705 [Kingdonia uniflora]